MGTATFLRSWREALCEELRTNHAGQLLKRLTKVADLIPADFPDINILYLYLAPRTTDYSTHPFVLIPGHGVDWPSLALFCERSFTWADAGGILRYFVSYVFPGHAVWQLVMAAAAVDSGLEPDCFIFGDPVLKH
jgi:hypothetical protein